MLISMGWKSSLSFYMLGWATGIWFLRHRKGIGLQPIDLSRLLNVRIVRFSTAWKPT